MIPYLYIFRREEKLGFLRVRKMTEKSEAKNRKTGFPRKNINKENQRKEIKLKKTVNNFDFINKRVL